MGRILIMCRHPLALALFTSAVSISICAPARAAEVPLPTVSFTGELHMKEEGRRLLVIGLAHTPRHLRYNLSIGRGRVVVLVDRTAKRAWLLDPTAKRWRKATWHRKIDVLRQLIPSKLTSQKVGTDTIQGLQTNKFEIDGTTPAGTPIKGHIWVTPTYLVMKMTGYLRRRSGARKILAEMKKVKVGKVDPSLFRIPADYKEVPVGGGKPANRK